jgi:hypothetical protein
MAVSKPDGDVLKRNGPVSVKGDVYHSDDEYADENDRGGKKMTRPNIDV